MDIQFLTLNSDFTINSIIYPTNIQWKREYYEAGTFSIQLPMEQYDDSMKYVYTKSRPEVGIISQVNFTIDTLGFQSVQISGYFLESELDDKIIYPAFRGIGTNVEDVIVDMVTQYKQDIPNLSVAPSQSRGTATNFSVVGDNLGSYVSYILKLHEMSYSIIYDYTENAKTFVVWQGHDRTEMNGTENPVKFSTAFGNLKQPDVVRKEHEYKNYAIVHGVVDDVHYYVEADMSNGDYKRCIYIDDASVDYDAEKMTIDEYKEALRQFGLDKLKTDYCVTQNIEFDVLEGSYEYMIDFDLGDKCDIVIEELNLTLEARIISIYEVIKSGSHSITLEFGDQIVKKQ